MIYFRCETSSIYGLGHIKRCVSLASSLNRNTSTCFIIREANSYIIEMIEKVGSNYHKIPNNLSLADEIKHYPKKSKNIIVDMINQGTIKYLSPYLDYLNKLNELGFRTVIIEGLDSESIRDTRIPSVEAFIQPYWTNGHQIKPISKFWFYGKNYVLLDRSYESSFKKRDNNKIKNILITFGGSDHQGNTLKALKGLNRSTFIDMNFKVVIGPYFLKKTLSDLKSIARSFKNISLINSPKSLRDFYLWADLCIEAQVQQDTKAVACGLPMIFCNLSEPCKSEQRLCFFWDC